MRDRIAFTARLLAIMVASYITNHAIADPVVSNVIAKQRYPWNGFVDITCSVSGVDTTSKYEFDVVAVMPNSDNPKKLSNIRMVRNGTNTTDLTMSANGDYHLLWNATDDFGEVRYTNMVVHVMLYKYHSRTQLWAGGPYWATTNIGADNPWQYGSYFWWGDTTASGKTSNSSNCPTYNKEPAQLQSEGWISDDGVLALEHDAAHVQWGGNWRMPTEAEFNALKSNCDWIFAPMKDVPGFVVRGRGDYATAGIFLPCAGCYNEGNSSLPYAGSKGFYWSSSSLSGSSASKMLYFYNELDIKAITGQDRYKGMSVRPVQGVSEVPSTVAINESSESNPFILDTMSSPVAGNLPISWSATWIGDDANATVVIEDNGEEIMRATNTGEFVYTLLGNGRHHLTYKTYIDNMIQDAVYEADVYLKWKYNINECANAIISGTAETGNIVIPFEIDGCRVVGIAERAFIGNDRITGVMIPQGVTNIGSYAFSLCSGLVSLEIPSSVVNIGDCAFQGCKELDNIRIPITCYIGNDAIPLATTVFMYKPTQTVSLDVADGFVASATIEVNYGAVYGEIPTPSRSGYVFSRWELDGDAVDGETVVYALDDHTLVAKWIPCKFEVIFDANGGAGGVSDKYDCGSKLDAPSVSKTGYSFVNWLPEVPTTVPDRDSIYIAQWTPNKYEIRFDANGGVGGWSGSLDYESALTAPLVTRTGYSFAGWTPSVATMVPLDGAIYMAQWEINPYLSSEDIDGKTMKELYPDDYADMTEVVLEDGILELPEGFFDGCESLVSLTLPSTLETIGLDDLPPRIKERQSYGEDGFMVYEGWVLGYSDKNATSLTLPEVSGIGTRAFAGFYDLETVLIPGTVSRIGREAFSYDTSLDNVVIPDGVTTICASAFKGCTYLRSITMGSGVGKVGASAFAVCTQLTTFTLPDSVTEVGDCAFSNCWRMLSVRLPLGVEVAGNEIFADCTSLVGVTVPAGRFTMRRFLGSVFEQITYAVVVEGETELCANAFAGCGALESVIVQSGVTNINEQAFSSCANLVDVSLPETLVAVGEHAFRGCVALEAIVLPDSVERMGDGAFRGCGDLSSVTLSRSLAEIPGHAFYGCDSLVSMVVPASVARLGGYLSTALRSLYFLGNAPSYDVNAYALMPDDATTYVVQKTKGWDGIPSSMDLPKPEIGWIGHPITFWTPNRFDATFDANGGEFPNEAETYACEQITDTSYAMPPFEPVRTGYAFAGWWTDRSEGAQVKATTRVNETRDTTFYAHWMLVSKPVTVRFHANGGTVEPDEGIYYAGLPYETLPVPTREHYAFAGWFTMPDGGAEVLASSEVPAADTELFAHWTPETYTIRYNANGGSGVMADQQFSYGASVTLTANSFSRQGCVFVGWGMTEDGPVVYTDQKEIGTFGAIQGGVVNLYAQWTVPRYAVRYDSNGGVGVMTNDTFTIGVSGELSLNAFTRPGYVFIGWATTVDGEVAYGDGETVVDLTATANGNVSLFAVWARNTSNVEFSFDGDSPWRPARFARDGEAVWQSGSICDSEISDIVATVNGNGTISFEWSSSCEESYKGVRQDYLAFFVDGEELDYINGSSAWAIKSWTVSGDGPHVLKWSYIKDSLDAGHDDCARITRVVWEPGLNTLAEFANVPNVTFSTTGDAVWFGQTAVSHDGVAALQSGSILDGEETRLECAVVGAGELSFWWKSSCEGPHKGNPQDYASFVLNGVRQTWIAGETDWTNVVIRIDGNQRHNLCWIFQKDVSDSDGNDCAWLDEVIWTPSGPVIEGDDGADITGDSENGYTVRPSNGKKDVVVTIPEGVKPENVTVEVSATVATVKANGAKVKVMNKGYDIAEFLDLAAVTSSDGVINLAEAKVKDEVAKEALDTASGADIKLSPTDPSITTANTRPGLKYTFVEGRTIEELAPTEQCKWGDNTPFKPTPSINGGTSGFYTIKVEK